MTTKAAKANEVASEDSASASAKTETINVLSVQQPYADDIFFGGKLFENRSWSTDFRGELFIHSSKIDEPAITDALEAEGHDYRKHSPTGLATGVILGRVNLVACVRSDDLFSIATEAACKVLGRDPKSRPFPNLDNPQIAFLESLLRNVNPICWQHFCFADYVWVFTEADMLDEPIPIKGRLRIWKTEVETEKLTLASLRKKSWKPKPALTKT